MAGNNIVQNGNDAPFVPDEYPAGEADVYPGNALDVNANGEVIKHAAESGTGRGMLADVDEFDPSTDRDTAYPNGERAKIVHVPIGGRAVVRLAAGGDLTTAANANVTEGDILAEANVGGFADEAAGGTGAKYLALEDVDNSGAAAGVANQKHIEVVRVA